MKYMDNKIEDKIRQPTNIFLWKSEKVLYTHPPDPYISLILQSCLYVPAYGQYLVTFEYEDKLYSGFWEPDGPVQLENKVTPLQTFIMAPPSLEELCSNPGLVYRLSIFRLTSSGSKILDPLLTNLFLYLY